MESVRRIRWIASSGSYHGHQDGVRKTHTFAPSDDARPTDDSTRDRRGEGSAGPSPRSAPGGGERPGGSRGWGPAASGSGDASGERTPMAVVVDRRIQGPVRPPRLEPTRPGRTRTPAARRPRAGRTRVARTRPATDRPADGLPPSPTTAPAIRPPVGARRTGRAEPGRRGGAGPVADRRLPASHGREGRDRRQWSMFAPVVGFRPMPPRRLSLG